IYSPIHGSGSGSLYCSVAENTNSAPNSAFRIDQAGRFISRARVQAQPARSSQADNDRSPGLRSDRVSVSLGSMKSLLRANAWWVAIGAVTLVLLIVWIDPAPPREITLATGAA